MIVTKEDIEAEFAKGELLDGFNEMVPQSGPAAALAKGTCIIRVGDVHVTQRDVTEALCKKVAQNFGAKPNWNGS